jgi:hypothetical protein
MTVVLGVLARLPFAHFQIIPHYLDFHPGVILVPLAGVFFGPAGAWGSLAASLIGDRLMGPWGAISIFRALGFFFFALSAQKMWNFSFWFEVGHVKPSLSWSHTARFILVSWPGCALAASWQGLGSELLRLYPFIYVASLLMLNNMLFCTLLGLVTAGIAAFPGLAAERKEEGVLEEIDQFVEDRLVSRMPSIRKTEFPVEHIIAMRQVGLHRRELRRR